VVNLYTAVHGKEIRSKSTCLQGAGGNSRGGASNKRTGTFRTTQELAGGSPGKKASAMASGLHPTKPSEMMALGC
jgi:hypothetical protein